VRQQTASAESPAALLKRYGDAIRGVLSRMPNDPADIPAWQIYLPIGRYICHGRANGSEKGILLRRSKSIAFT